MPAISATVTPPTDAYLELYEREALHVERYANPSYWDARYHNRRQARIQALLKRVLRPNDRFLDAGCGTGEYLAAAAALDGRPVGVDLARNYVVRARAACPEGAAVQASLATLPFPPHTFPVTLCTEVLEHLPPDVYTQAVDELFRTTGRALIVTTPNYGTLRRLGNVLLGGKVAELDASVGHIAIYRHAQLRELLGGRGWRIVTSRTLHILPPVIGEVLHLPRLLAPVITAVESLLNRLLPHSGNVSMVVLRPASTAQRDAPREAGV